LISSKASDAQLSNRVSVSQQNLNNLFSKIETINSKSVKEDATDSIEEDEQKFSESYNDEYDEEDEIYGLTPLCQTITM